METHCAFAAGSWQRTGSRELLPATPAVFVLSPSSKMSLLFISSQDSIFSRLSSTLKISPLISASSPAPAARNFLRRSVKARRPTSQSHSSSNGLKAAKLQCLSARTHSFKRKWNSRTSPLPWWTSSIALAPSSDELSPTKVIRLPEDKHSSPTFSQ